jgi:hypothetical protein
MMKVHLVIKSYPDDGPDFVVSAHRNYGTADTKAASLMKTHGKGKPSYHVLTLEVED